MNDESSKKLKADLIRKRELSDIAAVLQSREGRRFIWRLLESAGVFKTTMTGNSWTYFNEGLRSLGLKIYSNVMDSCPDRLKEMWAEGKILKEEEDSYGR